MPEHDRKPNWNSIRLTCGLVLTPREVVVMRAICDPKYDGLNRMAYGLFVSEGSLKVYLSNLYQKLGWVKGSTRRLALFALAHREELGINMPTPEQYSKIA